MNKSKASELSEWMRLNCNIKGNSLANRKPVYGVGINDSDYTTKCVTLKLRCPIYEAWKAVLMRSCAKEYKNKNPTYENVIICDEWLIFSNFRKWFIENHIDDYHLDKDILSLGSKIYSPETCIYVPRWLNNFITSSNGSRGKYKIGVCWDKVKHKFSAQCNNPITRQRGHVGYFNNETDAHMAWLDRKLSIALELKPEMDIIDLRIYPNIVDIIISIT